MSKKTETADHIPGAEQKQMFNQESFLKEFETIRPRLQSYLFRITAHTEDTEDLLQERWIKASRNLFTFQQASSLKTWIFAIATNLAKDHLRSKKRWPVNAMDMAREASMKRPDIHIAGFMAIHQSSPHGAFELREHLQHILSPGVLHAHNT